MDLRKTRNKYKNSAASGNVYNDKGGSPLRSRSNERDKRSVLTEEAYERSRQDKLRREIAIKEKQLAAMADVSQRMRLRIGSYADSGRNEGKGSSKNVKSSLSQRDYNILRNKQSNNSSKINSSISRSPLRNRSRSKSNSKSPAVGGGLRAQKGRDQLKHDETVNRITRERQKQSPLRIMRSIEAPIRHQESNIRITDEKKKQSPLRLKPEPVLMRSIESGQSNQLRIENSRSPLQYTFESKAARRALELTNTIEAARKSDKTSPLRKKSPIDMSFNEFNQYDPPVRDSLRYKQGTKHQKKSSIVAAKIEDRLRDRIETLNYDNQSLGRRQLLVKQELNRVQDEKENELKKCLNLQDEVEKLNKLLSQDDSVDHQNDSLKDKIEAERVLNKQLKHQIDDNNQLNQSTDKQIMRTVNEKNNINMDYEKINVDLIYTEDKIDKTGRELLATKQDINLTNVEIENLGRQESDLKNELDRLNMMVSKLQRERNELLEDLEGLTNTFVACKKGIQNEHQDIHNENKWKTKLVVAKILFNDLSMFQQAKQVDAFKEVQRYGMFDKHCFTKLKRFSLILYKLGNYNKEKAIYVWYQNAMKPLDTRFQNYDIATKISVEKLLSKTFYGWKKFHQSRMNTYQSKTESISKIWEKLVTSSKSELKRAMDIWKNAIRQDKQQVHKIKAMLINRYKFQLSKALLLWKNYSMNIDQSVRIIMLQREYSQKLFLSRLFNELRQQTLHLKQKRLRRQGLVFKGWQSQIAYRKQLTITNMLALQLGSVNKKQNLRSFFDALKVNKENQKFKIMNSALKQDMDLAITENSKFNNNFQSAMTTKSKIKSGNIIRDMMAKRLYAYFCHWKVSTANFKNSMNTKIKDRIFSMYRGRMLDAFIRWKKNSIQKKARTKKKMIMQMEEQGKELENENIQEVQKNRAQAEGVRSTRERKGGKMFKKFMLRAQKNAFDHWHDRIEGFRVGKARNNQVLQKMRMRFIKDAFGRFKEFSLKGKQHEKNEISAEHLIGTLNKRTLRRHYNAFCQFTHRHKLAKKYWKRILQKMDLWQKKRTMKRWRENGNQKRIFELQQKQNETAAAIEGKNKKIGAGESTHNAQSKALVDLEKELRRKAHKQLGNYLQRFYTDTTASRFKFWKAWTSKEKQKTKIMKSMIDHMRKNSLTLVRNAFKTFISVEKQKERRKMIRQQMLVCEEQERSIINNEESMQEERVKVKAAAVRSVKKAEVKQLKIDKTIDVITRRSQQMEFCSRKRKIFEQWRFAVMQQKAFLLCVKNVLEKSMQMKGFHYIKNSSSETAIAQKKYTRINMAIMRFMKRNMGDFFTKWKNGAREKVDGRFESVKAANDETTEAFRIHIKAIKKQNCDNIKHLFDKRRLKLIFRGWKIQKNYLKMLHRQQRDMADTLPIVIQRRAIQKWAQRVETTKRIRNNFATAARNKAVRLKRLVWEGIRSRRRITTDLSTTISNLEKLFRDKSYLDAFKTVKSFSISKKLASSNLKRKARDDIASLLTQTYIQRLRKSFGRYRDIVKQRRNKNRVAKKVLLKVDNANLRWAFEAWRRQNSKEMLAEELNQTGPITEQVFEANRTIRNLKEFMRKERYTEEEIAAKCAEIFGQADAQMLWLIKRLQLPKSDRVMQRCFDHWVFWLKVRKVMRYHLRFCNNQVRPVRCDIRWAFDRWKRGDVNFASKLDTYDFVELEEMNVKQSKALDNLADNEAENSAIINHLNVQRDELLEHYVRSQKLGLALLKDNHRRSRGLAFDIWKQFTQASRKGDGQGYVADSIAAITAVKQRMAQLEAENAALASENDELRQFSMDGFQIAKNVQSLSNEREKLSIDLADKTDIIGQLLEQNRRLNKQLEAYGVVHVEAGGKKFSQFARV